VTYNDAYEAVADLYDKGSGLGRTRPCRRQRVVQRGHGSARPPQRFGRDRSANPRLRERRETETYTFAELDAAANRVANYLSEHTDRGARIGAKLPTQFELYAVVFGTIKAGRIYLPSLAPVFGPDALNYRLEDSRASVLFTTASGCEIVDADLSALDRIVTVDGGSVNGSTTVDDYDAVREHDDAFDAVETHPNDPFTLTYTSGTTGSPKGVLSPAPRSGRTARVHRVRSRLAARRRLPGRRIALVVLWPQHGHDYVGRPRDSDRLLPRSVRPLTFFETLEEWDVDNAMIPPTALRQSRAAGIDLSEYDIDLRVLIFGG